MAYTMNEMTNEVSFVDMVPAGSEYDTLRYTLKRIEETFPDQMGEITQARVDGWIEEIDSGEGRTVDDIRDDIFKHVVGVDVIMSTLGVDKDTANQLIMGSNDGGIDFSQWVNENGQSSTSVSGVPSGGNIYQINRAGQDPLFAVMYEHPAGSGKFISYEFDSKEQMLQVVGENHNMTTYQRSEAWYSDPDRVRANAPVDEIAGLGGSYQGLIDDITREAAIEAGITDPSLIGRMAADPEMQEILASASIEGWSQQRILAEQRKTKFWTEVLYPGIDNFYAGSNNPEQDYRDYVDSVNSTLAQLGYARDADGTYKSTINQMLDSDVDATVFVNLAPTYVKATQNEEFRAAFDEWAQSTLGREVTFDDWFDLLSGEGEVEIALAAEQATIDYLAMQLMTDETFGGLDDDQITRLAAERNLTEQQLRDALLDIDNQVANLYGRGLEKYGLNDDDIFSARTGIASRSGRETGEITRKVEQALREEGLADEEKLKLYTAYSESSGAPNRPGLLANKRQGA